MCDEALYDEKTGRRPAICPACDQKITRIHAPYCMRCGKQLEEIGREFCHDCAGKDTGPLSRGLAAFSYTPAIKQSMYSFKNGRREYAEFYAAELDRLYHDAILSWQAEALVPVPLHPAKERKRGYNQARVLAEELGMRLSLPVADLLTRTRNTQAQKILNDKDRTKNLKNAFQLKANDILWKKLILIDDIYTTGSTLENCARALREAGADEIYFLTVCVGRGF